MLFACHDYPAPAYDLDAQAAAESGAAGAASTPLAFTPAPRGTTGARRDHRGAGAAKATTGGKGMNEGGICPNGLLGKSNLTASFVRLLYNP